MTIDTLRADHVGLSRDGVPLTPAVERLAADAVRYRDVLGNSSTTRPSHASLLSGLYPWRHRVVSNHHVLAGDVPWLPETLRARGFATGAVVSSIQLRAAESGMGRGFDAYDDRFDTTEANRSNMPVKSPAETTRVALAWLAANRGRDFFLWVHYFPPHGPYTPPDDFLRDLPDAASATSLPVSGGNYAQGTIPRYQRLGTETDPEAYRRRYAAHVRYVDHHVGRLLDGLRDLGLYAGALVVVTSDHGESLGEHDWYFCHGNLVYQEQVAVPLLLKLPGNREAGRVVSEPVEGVDVPATMVRVLGLGDVGGLDGRDVLTGTPGAATRPRFTQSEDAEVVGVVVAGRSSCCASGSRASRAPPTPPVRCSRSTWIRPSPPRSTAPAPRRWPRSRPCCGSGTPACRKGRR